MSWTKPTSCQVLSAH